MKKELMKRVAAAGLAVSMVAGLTACGPTGKPEETKKEETKAEGGETSAAADKEDAAASDGEVTLRFSWWGGDARHKATEAASSRRFRSVLQESASTGIKLPLTKQVLLFLQAGMS